VTFGGDRAVEAFRPLLRILNTRWIYDEPSGAMFTSDAFTYGIRSSEEGPWQLTEDDDYVDADRVREHLLAQRFWWLKESDVDDIRCDLDDIFTRYDVQHIAPTFGAIISGRATVQRHFDLMDAAIAGLGRPSTELAARR
jgi:hypothetical protein